jgi:hypothetical protein
MSTLRAQIEQVVPPNLSSLLDLRDGVAQLIPELQSQVNAVSQEQIWDTCGQYYSAQGRRHEALSIYQALYHRLLEIQEPGPTNSQTRVHKGTPLVRIADEHRLLGHPVLAKRYMMLTLCEDAISMGGNIPAETTGTYFRLVWQYGLSHEQLTKYASEIWSINNAHQAESRFPEWILQELDQDWMTEYPTSQEAGIYDFNAIYVRWLRSQLGTGTGKELERVAHYLLSCVPGFRARMRMRSMSTDYDVVCAVEGPTLDFRSEIGRYFLCECKDWGKPADVTVVVKFAAVLRSAKCRFGIVFSKQGITGTGSTAYAERELLKIFQHDDLTIVVISGADLDRLAMGDSFLPLLRSRYERARFDLPETTS